MRGKEKAQAIQLRKTGHSLTEIAEKLSLAKSTVSIWVRNVPLSASARKKIEAKRYRSRINASETNRKRVKSIEREYLKQAEVSLKNEPLSHTMTQLVCTLLYWCEGAKHTNRVEFTNADPNLVKLFLKLFRNGYQIDETKFRVCIHLHNYHNVDEQLRYWSIITKMPLSQFTKPFQKNRTGKRIRENYQGCVSIRYHDANMARRLHATAKVAFST